MMRHRPADPDLKPALRSLVGAVGTANGSAALWSRLVRDHRFILPAREPRFHNADSNRGSSLARSWEGRSEEHTSELQSLIRNSYAVFCLKKTPHIAATEQNLVNLVI